jgi:hypothetical protein
MSCYRIEKIGSLQDFAVKKISRHRSITADDVGNVRMEYQEFLEAKEKKYSFKVDHSAANTDENNSENNE